MLPRARPSIARATPPSARPKVWELAVLSCATAGVVTLKVTPAIPTRKKAQPARVTPLARLNNNSLLTNEDPRSDHRTGLRWRYDEIGLGPRSHARHPHRLDQRSGN